MLQGLTFKYSVTFHISFDFATPCYAAPAPYACTAAAAPAPWYEACKIASLNRAYRLVYLSLLTIGAATTTASKARQDSSNRRAPEACCRRCLSSKQLQRFDGKHRSPGPKRLAPPRNKYETLPRCWCVKLPTTDRTAQTRR